MGLRLSVGIGVGKGGGKSIPMPDYAKNLVFYYDSLRSTYSNSGDLILNDITKVGSDLKQTTTAQKPDIDANGITFDDSYKYLQFNKDISLSNLGCVIYFRLNRVTAADDTLFLGDSTLPEQSYGWIYLRSNQLLFRSRGDATFTGLVAGDITGDKVYKIVNDGTNITLFIRDAASDSNLFVQKGQVTRPAAWVLNKYITFKSIGSWDNAKAAAKGTFIQIAFFNNYIGTTQQAAFEAQLISRATIPNYKLVNKDCILYDGQSNANGRRLITEYPNQYQTNTKLKLFNLNSCSFGAISDNVDCGEGITSNTWGYYRSHETSYSYLKQSDLYMLKFARGSSSLADLSASSVYNWFWGGTNITFSYAMQLKSHWNYFNAYMKSVGFNPAWVEWWWSQGETDALVQANANSYEANLTALVNGLRAFIGFDIKMVIFRPYTPPNGPYYLTIQQADANVAATLNNVHVINCNSYPKQDNDHYNVTGYLQGGTDAFNQNYM